MIAIEIIFYLIAVPTAVISLAIVILVLYTCHEQGKRNKQHKLNIKKAIRNEN
jgi:hypothetical protein